MAAQVHQPRVVSVLGPATCRHARTVRRHIVTCRAQQSVAQRPVTQIPTAAETLKFPVPEDLDQHIANPGLPRANKAVSREHPDGAADNLPQGYKRTKDASERTVMQQHVDYFDTDADGIIWPSDTQAGFRRMGLNPVISFLSGPVIHSAMSLPTQRGFPDLIGWPIYTDRIHKNKHGSTSLVYDREGRFIPEKFEEIFSMHDKGNKGGLTWHELNKFIEHNRNLYDIFGSLATRLEWWVTWNLAAHDGLLRKEDIRGMFDASLFYRKEAEHEERRRRAGKASIADKKWGTGLPDDKSQSKRQ